MIQFAAHPAARGDSVLVLYRNWLLGRKGTTVVADSEAAEGNMGVERLLTETKSESYRSDSVATRAAQPTPEIQITHTLTAPRPFNTLVLSWTNLLLPWRADLYIGDPDTTGELRATTGWTHPLVRSELQDFAYGDFPWTLGPSDERVSYLAEGFDLHTLQTLPETVHADHVRWRIDCQDGANGSVDYVQIGLPWGGVAFRPHIGMSRGTNIEPVSRSVARRSAGGMKAGIGRRAGRGFTFALEHLTDEEADRLGTELAEEEGEFARVFAWREPEDRKRWLFHGFGGGFVGTADQFEGIAIEEPEGAMDDVVVAKSVRAIRIEETV